MMISNWTPIEVRDIQNNFQFVLPWHKILRYFAIEKKKNKFISPIKMQAENTGFIILSQDMISGLRTYHASYFFDKEVEKLLSNEEE